MPIVRAGWHGADAPGRATAGPGPQGWTFPPTPERLRLSWAWDREFRSCTLHARAAVWTLGSVFTVAESVRPASDARGIASEKLGWAALVCLQGLPCNAQRG